MDKKIFTTKFNGLCAERGWTNQAAAQKIGVSESTIANWRKGIHWPDVGDIIKIVEACEINDLRELFDVPPFKPSERELYECKLRYLTDERDYLRECNRQKRKEEHGDGKGEQQVQASEPEAAPPKNMHSTIVHADNNSDGAKRIINKNR